MQFVNCIFSYVEPLSLLLIDWINNKNVSSNLFKKEFPCNPMIYIYRCSPVCLAVWPNLLCRAETPPKQTPQTTDESPAAQTSKVFPPPYFSASDKPVYWQNAPEWAGSGKCEEENMPLRVTFMFNSENIEKYRDTGKSHHSEREAVMVKSGEWRILFCPAGLQRIAAEYEPDQAAICWWCCHCIWTSCPLLLGSTLHSFHNTKLWKHCWSETRHMEVWLNRDYSQSEVWTNFYHLESERFV